MINAGANPHVINFAGNTHYADYSLSNLEYKTPPPKSIYYTVKKIEDFVADEPFFYTNGIFPGTFDELLGHGGEGSVVRGMWGKLKVAYKFVAVENTLSYNLDKQLNEMTTINAARGTSILDIIGHYRYVLVETLQK